MYSWCCHRARFCCCCCCPHPRYHHWHLPLRCPLQSLHPLPLHHLFNLLIFLFIHTLLFLLLIIHLILVLFFVEVRPTLSVTGWGEWWGRQLVFGLCSTMTGMFGGEQRWCRSHGAHTWLCWMAEYWSVKNRREKKKLTSCFHGHLMGAGHFW